MATTIDWDSIETGGGKGGRKGSGGGTRFVKFTEGKTENLRPVGEAVQFIQFFANGKSVIVDPEEKDAAQALIEDAIGKACAPKKRYAYNVINREDGKIWVLTGGPQIFKNFATWSKMMGEDMDKPPAPGGKFGCDWKIRPEGSGINREYHCAHMKQTPFTEDEVAMIRSEEKGVGLYALTDLFKSTSLDDVVAKITGEQTQSSADVSDDVGNTDNNDDFDF